MGNRQVIDKTKMEGFREKVWGDLSGGMTIIMCHIGDSLGLFKELDANGPATSAELGKRAGVDERYAREWLAVLGSSGYLELDPPSKRYCLPPEHAPALAHEGGPMFQGGALEGFPAMLKPIDELLIAFRGGGGVSQSAFDEGWWEGMERFSDTWFENLLVQEWIPALPEVQAKLDGGIRVADVGCGRGRAPIKLAGAFPNSHFVGYDLFVPQLSVAADRAKETGVAGRVKFRKLDVALGLPEHYDLITAFDAVHDMADPGGALQAIRQALRPDGVFLMLETKCEDKPENNVGPIAALLYGYSLMYCMTTSLANGGQGLGRCGLPESRVRELCTEAGFSKVRRLPFEGHFNVLYEIKP